MADTTQEPNLKYLSLVHVLALEALGCLGALYSLAKDSSGPLKPSVDNVEGTVKTVVGPVYQKIEGKPLELLQFLDSKVDETLALLNEMLPPLLKEKSSQAYDVAKQAPDAARAVVADVQNQGLYETAASYYQRYEPAAEQLTYSAWQKLLTVPLVPQAVHLAAPAAKLGAQSYNNLATVLKDKQLPLADFIPLVPIERIKEATRTVPAQ
jgi:hypothetical protein